jgi:hypothetical protein
MANSDLFSAVLSDGLVHLMPQGQAYAFVRIHKAYAPITTLSCPDLLPWWVTEYRWMVQLGERAWFESSRYEWPTQNIPTIVSC